MSHGRLQSSNDLAATLNADLSSTTCGAVLPAAAPPSVGTITGQVYHTVNLGIGHYGAELTVASSGEIIPSEPGAVGVRIGASVAGAYLLNMGIIEGGSANTSLSAGTGLVAVASGAVITNDGTIVGGIGAPAYSHGKYDGGIGVNIAGAGTLMNSGIIAGGSSPAKFSNGGVGVEMSGHGASLINDGIITGGNSPQGFGNGGIGVIISNTATLTNAGTITGGFNGRYDGASILVTAPHATIINRGVVTVGYNYGVRFQSGGTLVNDGMIKGNSYGIGIEIGGAASITNNGTIFCYNGTAAGSALVAYGAGASIVNAGLIIGGSSLYGTSAGLVLSAGDSLSNSGGIGGNSGVYIYNYITGSNGAVGVQVNGIATVTNTGGIGGGFGAASVYVSGAGGAGIVFSAGGTLVNSGVIGGGGGGSGDEGRSVAGGGGGDAVVFSGPGIITNTGTIVGGSGGSEDPGSGGNGGDGVDLNGGTLITSGTIIGGSAGDGEHGHPMQGFAVNFGANTTLIVEPGAVFNGEVWGDKTGTFDFSGSSPGTLSGLDSQILGFQTIDETAGAIWTLAGPNTIASGTSLLDTGTLTFLGPLINDGVMTVSGGTLSIQGTATNTGTIDIAFGSLSTMFATAGNGTLEVGAAGTLTLNGVLSGQKLDFLAGTGFVDINHPLSFMGEIVGFGAADVIDLTKPAGFQANSYNFENGVLTIMNDGTTVASLHFAGSYTTVDFALNPDGHGGLDLTYV